jgi:hypothetical protein
MAHHGRGACHGMQIEIQGKRVAAKVRQYSARLGRHEVEWTEESSRMEPGAEGRKSTKTWVDFAADLVYQEVMQAAPAVDSTVHLAIGPS